MTTRYLNTKYHNRKSQLIKYNSPYIFFFHHQIEKKKGGNRKKRRTTIKKSKRPQYPKKIRKFTNKS